jgi:hypothetical protein
MLQVLFSNKKIVPIGLFAFITLIAAVCTLLLPGDEKTSFSKDNLDVPEKEMNEIIINEVENMSENNQETENILEGENNQDTENILSDKKNDENY